MSYYGNPFPATGQPQYPSPGAPFNGFSQPPYHGPFSPAFTAAPQRYSPAVSYSQPPSFPTMPVPAGVSYYPPSAPFAAAPTATPQVAMVAPAVSSAPVGAMDQLCSDADVMEAFAQTLNLISNDLRPALVPDGSGVVRVAVPFCGSFLEAPVVDAWLRRLLPSLPAVRSIDVHAHDIHHTADFPVQTLNKGPHITYRASHIDLVRQPMPPADLTLGIHPMITGAGWDAIVTNVLKNSRVAVFFMFAEVEKETLEGICQRSGHLCVAKRNPFGRAQFVGKGVDPDQLKRYNWLAFVQKA